MKIGILTFHRACNYGAVLQTYALQKAIASFNVQCEIIDYRCEAIEKTYKNFYIHSYSLKGFISAIIHYPLRLIRNIIFKRFIKRFLKLSNISYNRNNIQKMKYDKFVVGSDQVWNENITDGDPTFYLDFVYDHAKKISYAASFGSSAIDLEKQKKYLHYLSSFNSISVRECDSSKMLELLLGRKIHWLLDPVFLHSAEYWEKFVLPKNDKNEYIFVYSLHEKKTYRYADYLAKISGLKIITIPNYLNIGVKAYRNYFAGINQFLTYIKHARYIITDSFHATAYAIIFHKNVNVVLREGSPGNNRLLSLMKLFNMEHKIINDDNYGELTSQIDYSVVDEIKEKEIKKAMSFVQQNICGETSYGIN